MLQGSQVGNQHPFMVDMLSHFIGCINGPHTLTFECSTGCKKMIVVRIVGQWIGALCMALGDIGTILLQCIDIGYGSQMIVSGVDVDM